MTTPFTPEPFRLIAIREDGSLDASDIPLSPDDQQACQAMTTLYRTLGYQPPWTGYVAVADGAIVGGGAFVGPPNGGRVEIAYYTAGPSQQKGYATLTAQRLVQIALEAAPGVELCAKTEPRTNASTAILTRTGFSHVGSTTDHEIGEAWLWLLKPYGQRSTA